MRAASILLTIASVAASACGRDSRPTFDNPARPIEVPVGSEFDLALKSNQSTGYQWVLVDSAVLGPLQLVSRNYTIPRARLQAPVGDHAAARFGGFPSHSSLSIRCDSTPIA